MTDQNASDPSDAADSPDSSYDPSTVEVNRARQQGLGMGAKDVAYQSDQRGVPGGAAFGPGAPAGDGDTLIGDETQGDHFGQAGPPGRSATPKPAQPADNTEN